MRGHGLLFSLCAIIAILLIHRSLFVFPFALLLLFLIAKEKQYRRLFPVLIVVFLVFTIRTTVDELTYSPRLDIAGEEEAFKGRLLTIPNIDGHLLTFQMRTNENETLQVRYRIASEMEKRKLSALQPGMTCTLRGSHTVASEKRNPGGFDYRKYLENNRVNRLIDADVLDECIDSNPSFVDRLKRYRQSGLKKVADLFSQETTGVAQALLFGDRTEINEDIIDSYQTLGLIHVLVVSGLHVGIVTAFFYRLLIQIGITRERAIDGLLIFLPIYVLVTGGAPSVIRAAIMTAAVLIGLRLKFKLHPLDGICGAFILILLHNPNTLYHIGFQLSFLISMSLIVSAETIADRFKSSAARLLAVAAIAQLVSLPLLLYYFYQFSPMSLLVNVVFVPIFSVVILPLSFITFLLSILFPFLSEPFVFLFEMGITVIHWTLISIKQWPLANIVTGKPSPLYTFAYFTAIFYAFVQMEKRDLRKFRHFTPLLPLILLLLLQLAGPYFNPYGKVTMIDVGQGDSILIELPFRKAVYLIDTGGQVRFGEDEDWQSRRNEFDVGKDFVLPVLKAKGIRQVDKLILSHGDEDHIGGTEALFRALRIREILYGKSDTFDEREKTLLTNAIHSGIRVTFVERGMHWQKGNNTFHVLAPEGSERDKNERSIVIYANLGSLSWLFTGDLEEMGEAKLLRNYPKLKVDVLKVAHHGSNTSTSERFIQQLEPRVALISTGKNNLYGHPHQDVIARLQSKRIAVLRTDEHGAITYSFTNRSGKFRTMQHEKKAD